MRTRDSFWLGYSSELPKMKQVAQQNKMYQLGNVNKFKKEMNEKITLVTLQYLLKSNLTNRNPSKTIAI